MSAAWRWPIRVGTALGITLVLWLVALATSVIPTVVSLGTNVHGLSLADYSVMTLRRLAPLSDRIIQEAQQDRPTARPSASPSPTSGPSAPPTPTPAASIPGTPAPTPIPTLPPLPTPTVPPLPTPTIPPVPTPSLSPPPLP